jgi:hypothetical protein
MERLLQSEYQKTASHRFRCGDDLVLSVLYAYTLQESVEERGRHRLQTLYGLSRQYSFLMLEKRFLWVMRVYLDILRKRPRFFCINDDLGEVSAHHPLLLSARAFLRLYFPWRAPVERSPGGA